jgi:hypothetical protein
MHGTVDNLSTELDAEKTARETADTNLQTSINDRYTKAETDALLDTESTARTNADTRLEGLIDDEATARADADLSLQSQIDNEVNERISGDNALQQNINNLDDRESEHYSDCTERIDNLDSRVTTNTNDIATINALTESIKGTGAGFHSSIYRGKYLGDKYTDEQKQAIINGTFDDLFIGDYWIINGITWRIADFDYYYNVYYLDQDDAHHVVIVPDTILYEAQMNPTDTTKGCYTGSEMYTKNLDEARAAFDDAFGSMFIATHKGYYSNRTDDSGIPQDTTVRDMRVELMSEEQVYGHAVWGVCNQNGFDVGTQVTQFRLFALDKTKINIGQTYWLTNVTNVLGHGFFAAMMKDGAPFFNPATFQNGVRPFACLF